MKFLKWFYNPFKPHIAKLNTSKYTVRKCTPIGWEYLDANPDSHYWWLGDFYANKYSQINTLEGARERLTVYNSQFIAGWRVE